MQVLNYNLKSKLFIVVQTLVDFQTQESQLQEIILTQSRQILSFQWLPGNLLIHKILLWQGYLLLISNLFLYRNVLLINHLQLCLLTKLLLPRNLWLTRNFMLPGNLLLPSNLLLPKYQWLSKKLRWSRCLYLITSIWKLL